MKGAEKEGGEEDSKTEGGDGDDDSDEEEEEEEEEETDASTGARAACDSGNSTAASALSRLLGDAAADCDDGESIASPTVDGDRVRSISSTLAAAATEPPPLCFAFAWLLWSLSSAARGEAVADAEADVGAENEYTAAASSSCASDARRCSTAARVLADRVDSAR